jgi:hypothetical protein
MGHQQTTPGIDIPSAHRQTATQSVAKQLFSAMRIERDNKHKRQDRVLRGFRQFDAPVCLIITYDRVLDGSDDTPFDCGAVATAPVNAEAVRSAIPKLEVQPNHAWRYTFKKYGYEVGLDHLTLRCHLRPCREDQGQRLHKGHPPEAVRSNDRIPRAIGCLRSWETRETSSQSDRQS